MYGGNNNYYRPNGNRRKPASSGNRLIIVLIAVIIICAVWLTLLFCWILPSMKNGGGGSAAVTTADVSTAPEPVVTEPTYVGYSDKTVDSRGIYSGDLLLITAEHPFDFDMNPKISCTAIYGNNEKNADYKAAYSTITVRDDILKIMNNMFSAMHKATGFKDVQITSGYRDKKLQQEIYDDKVEKLGEDEAKKIAALPGFSEHHLGIAFDCNVYTYDNAKATYITYNLEDRDETDWLYQNCKDYGFILRYPEDKTEITGINYEQWHFRYVGIPHAEYIYDNGLCFEEYITLLKKYPFDGNHLKVTASDGKAYEIYYIPVEFSTVSGTTAGGDPSFGLAMSEKTKLWLPTDKPYTISGNNADGFIVTVTQ